ncbi:MAG TPA: protein kinase, partial [Minicystis sp.]|nr:protein kinase [Minicystis sp.]
MLVLGRYALGDEIARGGIASVHLGVVLGDAGFTRPVAIKRLLPAVVNDPDLAAAFLDEARLASQVRHPNVVSTLDVCRQDGELFLVLEYLHGESLAGLVAAANRAGERLPVGVVAAVVAGALRGLAAAHDARDEHGAPLAIIHRDVTPHNL